MSRHYSHPTLPSPTLLKLCAIHFPASCSFELVFSMWGFFRHDAGSHFQLVHHCTRVSLEVTHCQTASVLGMYTLSNREKLTSLEQDLLCACSLSTPLTFTRLSKLQLEKCKKEKENNWRFLLPSFYFKKTISSTPSFSPPEVEVEVDSCRCKLNVRFFCVL